MTSQPWTIARSASEDSSSGRFYPPLKVKLEGRRVSVSSQDRSGAFLSLWPGEAERLGLALIQAAHEGSTAKAKED